MSGDVQFSLDRSSQEGDGTRTQSAPAEGDFNGSARSGYGPSLIVSVDLIVAVLDVSVQFRSATLVGFRRLLSVSSRWAPQVRRVAAVVFALIALLPAIRRIRHPTLLGDDVIRLVDLIEHPLCELLSQPFSEHVAPVFNFVSWTTWQAIGHDIRLAPLGFCVASVLPWVAILVLLGVWLVRETGSRTASLIAVALAAQSPLALETLWWYSASSFGYAVLGVMTAVLGASLLAIRPRPAILLIAFGSALGPAGTTIGILAMPLSGLRAFLDSTASWRRKCQAILAGVGGLATYLLVIELAGTSLLRTAGMHNEGMAEPMTGLGYALTVPGRLLWPAMVGAPPTWTIMSISTGLAWLLGFVALLSMLVLSVKPRAVWNRRLVVVGNAMIYLPYALTYCSRAGMVRLGRWTEPQLLYIFAGRYHFLPLLGACTVIAAVLAALPLVRRCDALSGRPVAVGILVGLLALFVNRHEEDHWRWMMRQPDQKATLNALHQVGEVARDEGISRDQLTRLFDPVFRTWNNCLRDYAQYFHFMKMVAQAPATVAGPVSDEEARVRLLSRLTDREQLVLGMGAAVSMSTAGPKPEGEKLVTARMVKVENVRELKPGHFQVDVWPAVAFIEYEVKTPPDACFLSLPGLVTDQDLTISWSDESGQWRRLQHVCWLKTYRAPLQTTIDIRRLANWPIGRLSRFRVEFTRAGEVALETPPYLLR
jgi:hypothetical protein